MSLLVQNINAVVERLEEVPALPRYIPLLVFFGFTKCIVPDYVGIFKIMIITERVIQLENDGDRHDNRKCLERVKKITLLASKSFPYLKFSNQCNIPSNHWQGMAKGKGPYYNCGREHYTLDFLHPRDEVNTKKAK